MPSLAYTDIKAGAFFSLDGVVYEAVSATFSKKSRQKGSNQVRARNLSDGSVVMKTLRASDAIAPADITKQEHVFVYARRGTAVIHPAGSPSERISVPVTALRRHDLVPSGATVTALIESGTILALIPPVKIALRVTEAPPSLRGNTSRGSGSKKITVETGATITVPLFIAEGDLITVNTETGEYVARSARAIA